MSHVRVLPEGSVELYVAAIGREEKRVERRLAQVASPRFRSRVCQMGREKAEKAA